MNVSPNELRKQTVTTLKEVDTDLKGVKMDTGLTPIQRSTLSATLLLAKVQCLNTLVLLQEKR
jgi:hypothetical protein